MSESNNRRRYKYDAEDPLRTGHDLVDKIGAIQLDGLIHDPNWWNHPLLASKDNKKARPRVSFQIIWAYLVDRYRPYKRRDSETGQVRYIKKFVGEEYWATTYSRFAREVGTSESIVRQALAFFVEQGLAEMRPAPHARQSDKNEKPFEVWPVPDAVRLITGRGDVPFVELAPEMRSGSAICDEMAQIRIQGDIIDYAWLGHKYLCNEQGKFDGVLALGFARLLFLYTPTPHVHPVTHQQMPRTKKFDGPKLYKSYRVWSQESGLSDEQLRRMVALLKKNGLFTVEIAPIIDRYGEPTNNKVLLEPVLDKVLEMTYGTSTKVVTKKSEAPPKKREQKVKSGLQKTGGPSPKTGDPSLETGGPSLETGGPSPKTGDITYGLHPSLLPSTEGTTSAEKPADEKSHDFAFDRKTAGSLVTDSTEVIRAARARLLHLAEVQQITLSEETATEIVARFPEIRFTSDDIVARLTRDYKLARLDHLIDPVQAREWVQEDVERARWWLIIWPGFRESTDEFIQTYRSRKTGKPTTKTRCFCNKWRSEETPQREWLLGWVRRVEGEKRAAEQKRNRQIADQTWSSLTFGLDAEARQALDRRLADAIRLRLQQAHREYVSRSDPRYEAARIWVLSQPGAEERLSAAPEPEPHPVLPPAPNPEEISPAEQKRLLLYVDEFARLLDVGEITDEDLENELATRKTLASHSAVWLAGEVRRAVMLLQEKREQDAQRLWDSLTSAQQQALEYRVRADLRSHFPGRPADPGSAEWLATRVRLINNTSVFATLLKVKVELTEQDLLTLWQITPAEEPKQLSIEDYVGAILDLVRGGQLMVGKVSDHLKTTAPHLKRGERSKIIKLVADRYLAA